MNGFAYEMKVTQDMVGLEMKVMNVANGREFDETTVNVKFMKLTDEGLELFGVTEDDIKS